MATLTTAIGRQDDTATAIIIPSKAKSREISFQRLQADVNRLRTQLASFGLSASSTSLQSPNTSSQPTAIAIALSNTYAFIATFLAVTSLPGVIAAPLNPAYKQNEFEFYIGDLQSCLTVLPMGACVENGPAVRATRVFGGAVAECWFDEDRVDGDVEGGGGRSGAEGEEGAREGSGGTAEEGRRGSIILEVKDGEG